MSLPPPVRELIRIIRHYNLTYDTFRAHAHAARVHLKLRPPKRGRVLPQLLTQSQLTDFFTAIDRSGNLQHQIMLRLLLSTAIRVAELVHIRVSHVDLDSARIFIESGKGDKDRYVLMPDSFTLTVRAYLRSIPDNEFLFESNHRRPYSTRAIQYIVARYGDLADIPRVHPHLLRHQCLTHLTRSGLTDAQIQLVSGHASKKSLERYQHIGLGDVERDYQAAIKKLDVV